jgi:hypothetical protein
LADAALEDGAEQGGGEFDRRESKEIARQFGELCGTRERRRGAGELASGGAWHQRRF